MFQDLCFLMDVYKMKNTFVLLCALLVFNCHAYCAHVYTIGDYDHTLIEKGMVTKLGPIPSEEIIDAFPQTFLETDGSYAGGEAFCSIEDACAEMKKLKASGILPAGHWRIYELQATWDQDVYKLHDENYRFNKSVKVLQEVNQCVG